MRTYVRRGGLLAVALLAALGGWLAAASPASAHNTLRSTSPADRSTVAVVPAEVVLTFDEPAIAMGTEIVVTGPAGAVADGPARLVDETVRQPIKAGSPAGDYTVQWRVTSADGHPITGTFTFTASAPGGSSAGPSTGPSAGASSGTGSGSSVGDGSAARTRVPTWVWPVIAAALLLSALTSAGVARRRSRRSR